MFLFLFQSWCTLKSSSILLVPEPLNWQVALYIAGGHCEHTDLPANIAVSSAMDMMKGTCSGLHRSIAVSVGRSNRPTNERMHVYVIFILLFTPFSSKWALNIYIFSMFIVKLSRISLQMEPYGAPT